MKGKLKNCIKSKLNSMWLIFIFCASICALFPLPLAHANSITITLRF